MSYFNIDCLRKEGYFLSRPLTEESKRYGLVSWSHMRWIFFTVLAIRRPACSIFSTYCACFSGLSLSIPIKSILDKRVISGWFRSWAVSLSIWSWALNCSSSITSFFCAKIFWLANLHPPPACARFRMISAQQSAYPFPTKLLLSAFFAKTLAVLDHLICANKRAHGVRYRKGLWSEILNKEK